MIRRIIILTVLLFAKASLALSSVDEPTFSEKLEDELSWLRAEAVVFSVAKREQKVLETASSVFIISNEDIKNSGVTSLPEALRLAPGVHVARINANQWAISIHGFNERFSNKLLVLIDGRSVYSPLFSGVYWDAQEMLLENIQRIEVIRGPSVALWGSNAVNGVINVITYAAKDTQGTELIGGYGTEEQGFGSLRYGGTVGENTYYRFHGKFVNRDQGGSFDNKEANDNATLYSGGIRIDTSLVQDYNLMITGNVYNGKVGQSGDVPDLSKPPTFNRFINNDVKLKGENLLARWTHQQNKQQNWALQVYYDHTRRDDSVLGNQEVNIFDFDFQRRFVWLDKQAITWGVQYRYVHNKLHSGTLNTQNPTTRDTHLYSAFISDEISLFQDQLKLTLASRFEHNDLTGFEIQPTARFSWLINDRNTFWGAISRSVKVPSISDHDSLIVPNIRQGQVPVVVNIVGNKDFDSEKIISYELGYRSHFNQDMQLDIAAFYNAYDDLRTFEQQGIFILEDPFRVVFPTKFDNNMKGYSYGLDLSVNWTIKHWWRINTGYSYAKTRLHLKNKSSDSFSLSIPVFVNQPEQMFTLRSSWDVIDNWQLDLWLRYVDRLEATDINAYVTMDARLAWLATKNLELSVIGQNLLDNQQRQFFQDTATGLNNSEVERGVYFKIKMDF